MDDKESARLEDKLDDAIEDSFPASDAPGNTVETGIRITMPPPSDDTVRDNRSASRFELVKNGHVAFLKYDRTADALMLVHTDVPPELRGQRIGDLLVNAALEAARAEGLRIVPVCPFVRAYLRKHPELTDWRE